MLRVLTPQGIKIVPSVSQLKQNTNFKGWICQPNQYVIDVQKWTVRQTVCGFPEEQSIDDFEPVEEVICPNTNCFCGNDIEMRKGKTEDHLKLIKDKVVKIEPYRGEELLAIDNENKVNVNFYTEKKCNFSCSYCEPENHTYEHSIDIEKYKQAWRIVNPRNVHTINISGGEPTLNKKYIDFIKWLKGNNPYSRISTSTNGTKSASYLAHLNRYSHLSVSIHFEFVGESYFQKLEQFLRNRGDNKKSIRFKCMLHPGRFNQVKNFLNRFKGYPELDMTVTPLWKVGTKEIMKYDEEMWSIVT